MKSLKIIQVLSKIGKILSKIIHICSIVGAVGCFLGLCSLPFADQGILKIGGVTLYGLIVNSGGLELNGLYAPMAGATVLCAGEAVLAWFAHRYFANELDAGTPFTVSGANELTRLGILTIAISMGSVIAARIVEGIITAMADTAAELSIEAGGSVSLGIMFLVISLLCRCGAELTQKEGSV